MTAYVLDNEAVQALADARHPKHQHVLAHLQGQLERRRSHRHGRQSTWVPTTVRVEAGWDRTSPTSALINGLRIADAALDRSTADATARRTTRFGVSPADAHLGATADALGDQTVVVLTSDPDDMALVCPPGTRIIRI